MKHHGLGAALCVFLWALTRTAAPPHAMPPGPAPDAVPEADSSMAPAPEAVRAAGQEADTGLVFVIVTGSRIYPEWREENRVRISEPFHISDTELTARVTRFLPDFRIDHGQFVTASRALLNPAAHIYVYGDSGAVDSTWAFMNFPPHFSPRSFWSFQLKEVIGYPPPSPSLPPAPDAKEESR